MKDPRTKIQDPEKHQDPNLKLPMNKRYLELGVWSFPGGWCLVFGAYYDRPDELDREP